MILWILFASSIVLTFLDSSLLEEGGVAALLLPAGSRNPSPRLASVEPEWGKDFSVLGRRWEFWFPTRPSLIPPWLGGVGMPCYFLPPILH